MSTYIYAVTASDHPLQLDDLTGVGDPPGELRVMQTAALAAVISDAPDDLRAKRRDLVAHQAVLERLLSDGAALPMRFGLVAAGDEQVVSALEENRDEYIQRLGEIDGCLEYNLKVSRDEQDMLREIVENSPEVHRLNEHTRENPNAHDDKVALGELISREVQDREQHDAASLVENLAPNALKHSTAEPTTAHFLNVSFLVRRDEVSQFANAVDVEAQRRGEAYALKLNGPLPPYSFV